MSYRFRLARHFTLWAAAIGEPCIYFAFLDLDSSRSPFGPNLAKQTEKRQRKSSQELQGETEGERRKQAFMFYST